MVAIVFITTWGVRSASVYSSWIAIELNLLFLLPIITHHNYFYGKFSAVKYFIIQRISGLIILTVVTLHVTSRGSSGWLFTLLALFFLKLGAAPFYQWVLSIGEHQSWWTIFILLTIQKLVPFYLINRFGRQGIFYLRTLMVFVWKKPNIHKLANPIKIKYVKKTITQNVFQRSIKMLQRKSIFVKKTIKL